MNYPGQKQGDIEAACIIMPMHGASDYATKAMLKPILRSKTGPDPKPEALRDKLNDEYSSGLDSPPGE